MILFSQGSKQASLCCLPKLRTIISHLLTAMTLMDFHHKGKTSDGFHLWYTFANIKGGQLQ